MSVSHRGKAQALDEIEPQFIREGYRVLRNPNTDQLPDFLRGHRFDMIAVGKVPNVAVVVKLGGTGEKPPVSSPLKPLFEGRQDWTLKLYYFETTDAVFDALTEDGFARAFQTIQDLAELNSQAAFLMAWSLLEAAARDQEVIEHKPMDERRVIGALASEGILQGPSVRTFLDLATKRNSLAHGQLNVEPSRQDILSVLDLARQVRRAEGALMQAN